MPPISHIHLINIGFISKPSGFAGELLFALEQGEAEDYLNCNFFFLILEGKPVPFRVENTRINGPQFIVKLEDINAEATAKTLSGKKIMIERTTDISGEKEMEWNDLVGYEVIDQTYGNLGKLLRVEEYPQQVIAQCTVNNKEVLFPLHEDFITSLDDKKKELFLDLPEGLLDVYLK